MDLYCPLVLSRIPSAKFTSNRSEAWQKSDGVEKGKKRGRGRENARAKKSFMQKLALPCFNQSQLQDRRAPTMLYLPRYGDLWAKNCVNPASWMPPAAGAGFTKPLTHKYAQLSTYYERVKPIRDKLMRYIKLDNVECNHSTARSLMLKEKNFLHVASRKCSCPLHPFLSSSK